VGLLRTVNENQAAAGTLRWLHNTAMSGT
jgi:hypothetical protein